MRTFLAIFPSKSLLNSLSSIQSNLTAYDKYLRFTKKDYIHMTIRFLGGKVSNESASVIKERLSSEIKNISAFNLRVKEVRYGFPDKEWPRILYTSVVTSEGLDKLRVIIENICSNIEDVEYFYEFSPEYHFTIARTKRRLTKQVVQDIRKRIRFVELVKGFLVEKIALVESLLSESGPTYKKLEEFVLAQ